MSLDPSHGRPSSRLSTATPPHVVVLFGAAGDLARRRLLPGMASLVLSSLAPNIEVVGTSLEEFDSPVFRGFVRDALSAFGRRALTDEEWSSFASRLHYVPASAGASALAREVAAATGRLGQDARLLHYLSVPTSAALSAIDMIAAAGLAVNSRIVMEKPFGNDLASAVKLNRRLQETFGEERVFRIDHFLGKEAVQNILAVRFANGLFEPIWHRDFIEHIQIDVPEMLGIEQRIPFYEATARTVTWW